jgi:membrane protein YqaA with SNARE-associated domain
MSNNTKKIFIKGGIYVAVCISLYLLSLLVSSTFLEYGSLMLLAGTFLPMPADTYVLFISEQIDPIRIGIVGGIVNAIAVIFEKYWLKDVMKVGALEKFSVFFANSKFTKYMNKSMFFSLLISGFSFFPHEPFRLVAVVKNYNDFKYFIATFLGRGFRYYLLAIFGDEIRKYDMIGLVLFLSLFGFFWGVFKMTRKKQVQKPIKYTL